MNGNTPDQAELERKIFKVIMKIDVYDDTSIDEDEAKKAANKIVQIIAQQPPSQEQRGWTIESLNLPYFQIRYFDEENKMFGETPIYETKNLPAMLLPARLTTPNEKGREA